MKNWLEDCLRELAQEGVIDGDEYHNLVTRTETPAERVNRLPPERVACWVCPECGMRLPLAGGMEKAHCPACRIAMKIRHVKRSSVHGPGCGQMLDLGLVLLTEAQT